MVGRGPAKWERMKIVVDENIPFGIETFGQIGDVITAHGRKIDAGLVRDADLLIVRSITRINGELLEGSRVKFVGTCTIGTDHVDTAYLDQRGIAFASAPGCNANSVAEYIIAALLVLARRGDCRLEGKTIGVVGIGNVGSKVVEKCRSLGMRVLQNDPPLARQSPHDPRFLPLDELMGADFITLHVPLTKRGPDRTWHMADRAFLDCMKHGAVLLNTCRGAVLDNAAPDDRQSFVLDVWEGEPDINIALLDRVALGTPHIAGYSYDGKVTGTAMVYESACRALGLQAEFDPLELLPPSPHERMGIDASGRDHEDVLRDAVLAVYDIEGDDRRLRAVMDLPAGERGARFDRLRKEYPQRREFQNTTIELIGGDDALRRKFAGIGFRVGGNGRCDTK